MSSSDEKHDITVDHVENHESPSPDLTKEREDELLAAEVRATAERRLVRTLDMRLLPTIIVIFIMNYIDVSINAPPHSPFVLLGLPSALTFLFLMSGCAPCGNEINCAV